MPGGLRFLVDLRADVLEALAGDPTLAGLQADLETLLSAWFDVGLLEMRRLTWHSPASLLEKLVQYEAVHAIGSWSDLKNRLDEDRRCYAFFHPRLPDEPLIFVEVALGDHIADNIAPLLDEAAAPVDLARATTAVFYSISNTQTGLRGVSFGDSLIKRVVEALKLEFPRLNTFATLSPIPGFRGWLTKNLESLLERLDEKSRASLARALRSPATPAEQVLASADNVAQIPATSPVRKALLQFAAHYLAHGLHEGRPIDAVARFHLGNGARVERIHWAADPSAKGHKQSFGLMVNYLYDLKKLDRHRALLAQGKIPVSAAIQSLEL
jgi:malonyl-CoA decarboxylase